MRWIAIVAVLVACEKTDTPPTPPPPDPLHGIELPEVAGPGYIAASGDPSIVVTTRGFVVDGMEIVGVTDGDVAPTDKENGALGMNIPRLAGIGGKLAAKHVAPPLVIAVDKHLPYRLLVETLFSLKQKESGWKQFAVLAKAKGSTVMVPITLPDKAPPSGATMHGLAGDMVRNGSSTGRLTRLSVAPAESDASTLTPGMVMAKVQSAYIAGMKRCYQAELAVNAATGGKLRTTFTVTTKGRLVNAHVDGISEALSRCIEGQMASWRFPVPKTSDGDATDASFAVSFVLTPDNAGVAPPVPTAPAPPPPEPEPIKLVVSLLHDRVVLWSISGLEGTLHEPKATIATTEPTAMAQLSTALVEIVHRRWPGQRPDDTRNMILMLDGKTSMQATTELLGAVRAAADGTVLFPDVLLSSGFE
jgi:hypothetical protein